MSPNTILKIIIVDDNSDDQYFIKDALSHFKNLRFESFYSPENFIAYLGSLKADDLPDIVIMDINMPKLTGFEVIESIRKLDVKHKTKFFILSSSITQKDQARCDQLNLDCFTKPYSPGQFRLTIQEILDLWEAKKAA